MAVFYGGRDQTAQNLGGLVGFFTGAKLLRNLHNGATCAARAESERKTPKRKAQNERLAMTGTQGQQSFRDDLANRKVAVTSRDGMAYVLRPIQPSDAESLMRGYAAMSDEAKHNRMLYRVPALTPQMAAQYCSPDPERDYVVVVEGRDALAGEILGGARITGLKEGKSAQVSVSLRPEAERKGLGKAALMAVLRVAKEKGMQSVWGIIVTDNKPMMALARSIGFDLAQNPEDGNETLARLDLAKVKL